MGDAAREIDIDDPPAAARAIAHLLAAGLVGPPGRTWSVTRVLRSRSHGGTLLFRATADGRSVAAKLFRNRRWAEVEERASREAGHDGAPVARPLACDPARGLLVSEWIEGDTLSAWIDRVEWRPGLVAAGRWLRGFHRASGGRLAVDRPRALLTRLEADLAADLAGEDLARFRRSKAALLRRAAWTVPPLDRPVRLHGDFHARNLILSPKGPVGLDTVDARAGSRHDDLARMTVMMAVSAEQGRAPSAFDAAQAREAFLAAYGLTGPLARRRLALSERAELLRRWLVAARSRRPGKVCAVQAVLAQRGWMFAVLCLLAGAEVPGTRRDVSDATGAAAT